jgi:hypothetical protein
VQAKHLILQYRNDIKSKMDEESKQRNSETKEERRKDKVQILIGEKEEIMENRRKNKSIS